MAHTTCGSEKPTEESTRERDLGVSVGRDSRYGSIYVCPRLSRALFDATEKERD